MSQDWCLVSTARVEGAANDLREQLERLMDALREAQSRRLAGAGAVDIATGLMARGGRETRLAPTVAFRKFEAAVTEYRASLIRALVDEDQLTFTEVGRLTGASRQMVARLYHRAAGGTMGNDLAGSRDAGN